MKLYRSLVFRELKLTRKRFVLMLILFLLLALLMMVPMFLGAFTETAEMQEEAFGAVLLFSGIIALTGGLLASTNSGLQKADISSGWKQYSIVLPPTARQQALSDLLVKAGYILFFGALSMLYALVYGKISNADVTGATLNIYLGAVSAVMLVDTVYSYIVMFAKNKKELKILGVIAFFGAGLILRVTSLFKVDVNVPDKPADGGSLISDEAFNGFLLALCSGKTTLCILAVFAVICVLYFLVMWRSHERREP